MNSKKSNLRLIENITVQVPNTASINKDILFHVSQFLEKMVFNLYLKLSSEFANVRSVSKLLENILPFFLCIHFFSYKQPVYKQLALG